MKINRTALILILVAAAQWTALRAQGGDPNGWHDSNGSYLIFWQDFFVEDGGVVTAIGVSEEDYDNFGHFVHVTTTLHGGASNRVVTASATAKFFSCAESSFTFQPGSDEGTYYNDVQYSWTCPYLGTGFSEFIPGNEVIIGVAQTNYIYTSEDYLLNLCKYTLFCPLGAPSCPAQNPVYADSTTNICRAFLHDIRLKLTLDGIVSCFPVGMAEMSDYAVACF